MPPLLICSCRPRGLPHPIMSVAGLKKQFHKATQVGRVQVRHGRPRRWTDRRRPPLRPLSAPIRSRRSAARQPGSVTRLRVSDRSSLRDSAPWPPHPCFLFPLRVPVVPSTLAPGSQLPSPGITALGPRCLGFPTRVPWPSVPARQLSGSARRVPCRCLAARREIM